MKSIHLIAPSGASLDSKSPQAGIDWLGSQAIAVQNTDCVHRVYERFAGNDEERLAELNGIPQLESTLVMAMRGGYGLHRLLPGIQWDAIAKSVQNGIQICGHSDFTVFQLGLLAKTGAITLAGPMLNYDFGRLGDDGAPEVPDAFMWQHFQNAVENRKLECRVSSPQSFLGKVKESSLTGLLWGGNLTVLAGLVATPYLPNIAQTQGGILFLEDVNEHPYRIERMLMQLMDAGILSNQGAILLGGFSAYRLYDNDKGYSLERAIDAIRKRLPQEIPILTGLPFGHQANKLTLPVGAKANLNFTTSGFEIVAQW
ncbi:LD-carboxypeptidase [Polynucleobacter ibericus]|uniref:LD-carboxypeptidase n=1 Tax=Polynucleobacter ibericus TaxID=1819725 RepID=UPI001BFD367C|nr:LD-carboxypeptidase [Polynucleobacter ibericus]QWE09157.1 LD-carboxypeptidase [Polynucleobacter ibericus]